MNLCLVVLIMIWLFVVMYFGIWIINLVGICVGLVWEEVEVFLIDGFVFLIIILIEDGSLIVIVLLLINIMFMFWIFLVMNSSLFLILFFLKLYGV